MKDDTLYITISPLDINKIKLNKDTISEVDDKIIYKGIQYESNGLEKELKDISITITKDNQLIFEEDGDEILINIKYKKNSI